MAFAGPAAAQEAAPPETAASEDDEPVIVATGSRIGGRDFTAACPAVSVGEAGIFGRWEVSKNFELRFGIDNPFAAQPQIFGRNVSPTPPNSHLANTLGEY